jgi:transposase
MSFSQTPYLDKVSKKSTETVLKCLEKQIEKLETEAKTITQNDEELAQKSAFLQSVPGIGKRISSVLLGLMPELGTIENKSIAALAGLAPITKESGKKRSYAAIGSGRVGVRKAMYMTALVAQHHNKKMKTFYQKLHTTRHFVNFNTKRPSSRAMRSDPVLIFPRLLRHFIPRNDEIFMIFLK